ncbi:hypothetical protein AB3X55_01810 [Alphaproteobacteria bacterium LSUCC0719]
MTIRAFWKRGPPLRLIKRTDIPPDELFTSDEVRRAVEFRNCFFVRPSNILFYGHLVFMPVAWLLIQTWPPYHHAFVVTDWIADRLPSSVFGILTVTQAQLDEVGARLPRAAYIHFIVEQIVLAAICLVWPLTISVKMWRIYPLLEAHARHIHVNYDEYRNTAMRRGAWISIPMIPAILVFAWWIFSSPNRLLYMIEKGNGFGLLAINATGAMWGSITALILVSGFILALRGIIELIRDR